MENQDVYVQMLALIIGTLTSFFAVIFGYLGSFIVSLFVRAGAMPGEGVDTNTRYDFPR